MEVIAWFWAIGKPSVGRTQGFELSGTVPSSNSMKLHRRHFLPVIQLGFSLLFGEWQHSYSLTIILSFRGFRS